MVERRQHSRIPVGGLPGRLLGAGIPVQVLELSLQGLSLETDSALRPGGSYRLRLLGGDESVLDTRVIWCRLDRSERRLDGSAVAVYRAGLSRLEG